MAKRKFYTKPYILTVAIAVIAIITLIYFYHQHSSPKASSPGAPLTSLPSQKVANNTKSTANTQNSDINNGVASDQNGQAPRIPVGGSSQWSTSSSGLIVLKQPEKNSVFKSGDSIYGSATNGPVQFRLIDDQVGVIAQGTINLVDGNFSAIANFKSYASSGRLDVFNTDANGKEVNEVQIPVSF